MSTVTASKYSPTATALGNRCTIYKKPSGAFYADFRPFAAWGGRLTALVPSGERQATKSRSVATELFAKQLRDLMQLAERGDAFTAQRLRVPRLFDFIVEHLQRKAKDGKTARGTLRRDEIALRKWFEFLGNCELRDITPLRVQQYIDQRRAQAGRAPGCQLSNSTVRNDIHSLSNLLKRAHSLGYVSENVVARSCDKPAPPPSRTEFLERDDCARLLDAAAEMDQEARVALRIRELQRQMRTLRDRGAHAGARAVEIEAQGLFLSAGLAHIHSTTEPILEAVVSLLLYTGLRHDEVLGLLVQDIDFANGEVHVRKNEHRSLKRDSHARRLELWPGLRATLQRYLRESGRTEGLLFPTIDARGSETKRHSFSKQFDRVLRRARLDSRTISPHTLRHTFTTFMLLTTVRTLRGTEAVRSTWDVAQLLGHKSDALVRTVYSHIAHRRDYMDHLDFELLRQFPSTRNE